MKIIMTGASGFVGSHVLPLLLKQNVEVIAVARDLSSLDQYRDVCSLVEFDFNTSGNNYSSLEGADMLIHLAWDKISDFMSPCHYESQLSAHYEFIKTLLLSGVGSICVSGTCYEYGKLIGIMNEKMVTNPVTSYGLAKDCLRRQLEFLQNNGFTFDLTWMRLFYMHGQGQPDNTLYSQLKAAVNRGDHTFKMSGGEQLLDYLPVKEVAQKIVDLSLKNQNIGVVNVCNGKPISVRRLVEHWVKEEGWDIELELGYYPYREAETMAFWGDRSVMDRWIGG